MSQYKIIRNYQSADGTIGDYKFEILPKDGYRQMCKESIQVIKNVYNDYAKVVTVPDALKEAADELIASYQAVVDGTNPSREYNLDPNCEYIRNCRILDSIVYTGTIRKSTNHRSPKTEYKAVLRAITPMSNYVFAFKLEDGKYTSIEDCEVSTPLGS